MAKQIENMSRAFLGLDAVPPNPMTPQNVAAINKNMRIAAMFPGLQPVVGAQMQQLNMLTNQSIAMERMNMFRMQLRANMKINERTAQIREEQLKMERERHDLAVKREERLVTRDTKELDKIDRQMEFLNVKIDHAKEILGQVKIEAPHWVSRAIATTQKLWADVGTATTEQERSARLNEAEKQTDDALEAVVKDIPEIAKNEIEARGMELLVREGKANGLTEAQRMHRGLPTFAEKNSFFRNASDLAATASSLPPEQAQKMYKGIADSARAFGLTDFAKGMDQQAQDAVQPEAPSPPGFLDQPQSGGLKGLLQLAGKAASPAGPIVGDAANFLWTGQTPEQENPYIPMPPIETHPGLYPEGSPSSPIKGLLESGMIQ